MRRTVLRCLLAAAPLVAAGCQTLGDLKKTAYENTRTLLTSSYDDPQADAKLAAAEQRMNDTGDFPACRKVFADVAGNTQNPVLLAEKARFLEGECFRQELRYPDAVDTYHRMLKDFPGGAYRERACNEIFKIADYWLDDTREEITAARGGAAAVGNRLTRLVKIDRTKPTLDQEGRAIQALDYVHTNDITGPNADKALYWCGYVNFYRGSFEDADHYFSLLIELHKDSPLRPQAVELAVISKNNATGGAVYDGQKAAEALQLVHHAEATMPEFRTEEKAAFLTRQKFAIRMQQAEKDFQMAQYYERKKRPGSAYFYYEMVRRRYPGTKYADLSTARMDVIRSQAEKGDPTAEPLDVVRSKWDRLLGRTPAAANPDAVGPTGPRDAPPRASSIPDGTNLR